MPNRVVLFLVSLWVSTAVATSHLMCGIAQRRGKRDQMEDRAHCFCPLIDSEAYPILCFLAVYDGHEGSSVSQYLANHLHERFKHSTLSREMTELSPETIEAILVDTLDSMNRAVLDRYDEAGSTTHRDAGSTAVIAVIMDFKYLIVAHVGNSGAVSESSLLNPEPTDANRNRDLCSGRGHIVQEWKKSAPELNAQELECSTPTAFGEAGAWRIDNGLEVSRSIGDASYRDKGVISTPTITHFRLESGTESVILASDGVLDKLSADEVCVIVEEMKLGCPRTIESPPLDPAIPMGGDALLHNEGSQLCEPLRLGLSPNTEFELLGLRGCLDCQTDRSCNMRDPATFEGFQSREDTIAAALVEEAFNRRASDNLAATLINLSPVLGKESHAVASVAQLVFRGAVIKSEITQNVYRLLNKLMYIPRTQYSLIRVAEAVQPLKTEAPDQCRLDDWIEQKEGTLTRSRPLETRLLSVDSSAGNPYIPPDSCIPGYHLEAVDLQLLQALSALPRLEALPASTVSTDAVDGDSTEFFEMHSHYRLGKKFAGGAFGEIWKAVLHKDGMDHDVEGFVLKRIKSEKGEEALLSGLREAYFGSLFQQKSVTETNHLVRFVESFELDYGKEMWLVFRDEGISLHDLMYSSKGEDGFRVVQPSFWWKQLRQSDLNAVFETRLIQQLLKAVHLLHAHNVTHRDIKPENVLIEGGGIPDPQTFSIRLIDFGSAIDPYSMNNYYGQQGPSEKEQTREYAPPEAVFEKWIHMRLVYQSELASHYYAYDMWSIGVLWLEYILGTPHVFELPGRTRAHLDQDLDSFRLKAVEKEKVFLLRAMMEFCIYPPGSFTSTGAEGQLNVSVGAQELPLMTWTCTEQSMMDLLKARDVHSVGISSKAALRLLMSLLAWNPYDRRTAETALLNQIFIDA